MLHQILYIFQFTCLKLIVNYCIKHGALYVNDLYIHWATIYILSLTTKKHQKIISRLLHSKLKKIQALFKDLHRNLRTFQGKMEFKDFSRTSPKIQGLFKTVRTLLYTMYYGVWLFCLQYLRHKTFPFFSPSPDWSCLQSFDVSTLKIHSNNKTEFLFALYL